MSWFKFCRGIIWPITHLFYPTKVISKTELPKGKAIFACNHYSNMDILVIQTYRKDKAYIPAKQSLFKNKMSGKLLSALGAVPIDRENVGVGSIRTILNLLNNDNQVIIFPEGTRTKGIDEDTELKQGMALFALKANAPIIPMYMARKPKAFTRNKIYVGKPINLDKYKDKKPTKDDYTEIAEQVLQEMKNLKQEYLDSLTDNQLKKLNKQKA